MLILENGLIAFNIFGGAISVCVCGIVAHKRNNTTYRGLLLFEIALLFYAACILLTHHSIDSMHQNPPIVLSVITNLAFLLMFLVWKQVLSVRNGRKGTTKKESVLLVTAFICAILWTMDSIFFTREFVSQNLLGTVTSTLAGAAFAIMVIICYLADLKKEKRRMIWNITIILIVYIIYIQYIDISTCTNLYNPGVLQVITVHSCLTTCAVISLMILIFALFNVAREMSVDDEGRNHISVDLLRAEYGITPREMDVLEQIYRGTSNQDIAKQLFISENTVKKHINSIFRKLNINTRVDLISTYKITFPKK